MQNARDDIHQDEKVEYLGGKPTKGYKGVRFWGIGMLWESQTEEEGWSRRYFRHRKISRYILYLFKIVKV